MPASSVSLADAIAITGATTGQVPCEAQVHIPALSAAQKTALASFVTSLGAAWPGAAASIISLSVTRAPLTPSVISCNIQGILLEPDPTTAVTQQNAGNITHIIGQA